MGADDPRGFGGLVGGYAVIEAACECGFEGDFKIVAGDHREVEAQCPECGEASHIDLID
jgi:hypothetical protein